MTHFKDSGVEVKRVMLEGLEANLIKPAKPCVVCFSNVSGPRHGGRQFQSQLCILVSLQVTAAAMIWDGD